MALIEQNKPSSIPLYANMELMRKKHSNPTRIGHAFLSLDKSLVDRLGKSETVEVSLRGVELEFYRVESIEEGREATALLFDSKTPPFKEGYLVYLYR